MDFESLPRERLIELIGCEDEELVRQCPLRLPEKSFARERKRDDKPGFRATLVRRRLMGALLRKMSIAAVLDSVDLRDGVDSKQMTHRIANLARYLDTAFGASGRILRASKLRVRPQRVLIVGLGGSAIGPTVATEIVRNMGYSLPVSIHRHYPDLSLPLDRDALVIVSSYSGNTEESLSWYSLAKKKGCHVVGVAKGGRLAENAEKDRGVFIPIPTEEGFTGSDVIQQPRESIGFSMATFLTIFSHLGLATKQHGPKRVFRARELDFPAVAKWLDGLDGQWRADVPFKHNRAKQLAAHLLYGNASCAKPLAQPAAGRTIPLVLVDESNASVAMRLENQFGECVAAPIKVLELFEDAHNEAEQTITCAVEAKVLNEPDPFSYVALRSNAEMPRAKQRLDRTVREAFDNHGIPCERIIAQGRTPFEQKLYLLKLLDYARAYASILAGVEPLGVPFMDYMKNAMKRTKWPEGDCTRPM